MFNQQCAHVRGRYRIDEPYMVFLSRDAVRLEARARVLRYKTGEAPVQQYSTQSNKSHGDTEEYLLSINSEPQ